MFPTEEYAKFDAKEFKIYVEYGLYESKDYTFLLGIGKREKK